MFVYSDLIYINIPYFFIITWDGHLELNLTYHKILIAKLQKLMTISLCLWNLLAVKIYKVLKGCRVY